MTGISDFRRGDTKPITLKFKDKDGNPVDITGATIWFTVKKSPADDDSLAVIQKEITTHINPTGGISSFTIEHLDTNNLELISYYYDIQLVDAGGNVTTVIYGKFKLLPDITRSV